MPALFWLSKSAYTGMCVRLVKFSQNRRACVWGSFHWISTVRCGKHHWQMTSFGNIPIPWVIGQGLWNKPVCGHMPTHWHFSAIHARPRLKGESRRLSTVQPWLHMWAQGTCARGDEVTGRGKRSFPNKGEVVKQPTIRLQNPQFCRPTGLMT